MAGILSSSFFFFSETFGHFFSQMLRTGNLKCAFILYQLEEFDRASRSNGPANETEDDSRARHRQFVAAIGNQILAVEDALKDLEIEGGRTPLVWVRLDEGERDELAMFLSGPQSAVEQNTRLVAPGTGSNEGKKLPPLAPGSGDGRSETKGINREVRIDVPKSSVFSNEPGARDTREERRHGHRRAASVGADLGTWKSSISNEDSPRRSLNERPDMPPPKVLSFSGLSMAAESTWRIKWVKNGFRKWKGSDQHHTSDSIPLKTNQFSQVGLQFVMLYVHLHWLSQQDWPQMMTSNGEFLNWRTSTPSMKRVRAVSVTVVTSHMTSRFLDA